jgi:hypothetical protein
MTPVRLLRRARRRAAGQPAGGHRSRSGPGRRRVVADLPGPDQRRTSPGYRRRARRARRLPRRTDRGPGVGVGHPGRVPPRGRHRQIRPFATSRRPASPETPVQLPPRAHDPGPDRRGAAVGHRGAGRPEPRRPARRPGRPPPQGHREAAPGQRATTPAGPRGVAPSGGRSPRDPPGGQLAAGGGGHGPGPVPGLGPEGRLSAGQRARRPACGARRGCRAAAVTSWPA